MRVQGHQARQQLKEWAWSYSKLKNYEVCPKKHYEVDIAKTWQETQSDDPDSPLAWGNRVHEAFAACLKGDAPLPPEMASYQRWIDVVKAGPGKLMVEQKYAITRQFQPTGYFDNNVWYRGIGDVVRVDDPFIDKHGRPQRVGLIIDWKTGKFLDNDDQLFLMAQCLFSHFPDLTVVRSEFVWLKEDCSTPEVYSREEIAQKWIDMLPRVLQMETASQTMNYPPKPGRLCKNYCPVQACPFWKKGGR